MNEGVLLTYITIIPQNFVISNYQLLIIKQLTL